MLRLVRSSLTRAVASPVVAWLPAIAASAVGMPLVRHSHAAPKVVDPEILKIPVPPVVSVSSAGDKGKKIEVSWRTKDGAKFVSEVAEIFAPYGIKIEKQTTGSAPHDVTKACFQVSSSEALPEAKWEEIVGDICHVACLPKSVLGRVADLPLSRKEQSFAQLASKFAHQFVNRYDEDYHSINGIVGNIPGNGPKVLLSNLKRRLRHDMFNEANIENAICNNVELVKELYDMFDARFNPKAAHPSEEDWIKKVKDMDVKITKTCLSEFDAEVLKAINRMNSSMLKTNFYRNEKAAIAIRLNGDFLSTLNFPATPYGVFFILGAEFRGFHVRFADIARGGIRVIKSANRQAFVQNVSSVFDENYNLAYTQQKKNKDIPEGGSKGTVLLNLNNQDCGEIAFQKYVCSLMDVLVPECVQVDYSKRNTPEILFLGPDEYTADLMAWAVDYTKTRDYSVWKAVTTGKPPAYGGVPHDTYGMTTRSVHQCVLGALEMTNVPEESVTKFVTGGPDGDLGSNEVTISKDTIKAIVDGSGVLYDPKGLSREELYRLCDERSMVRGFDKSKLNAGGFFVDINDKNVTLPDGTVVEDGLSFRNTFHLNPLSGADLFVPCGGRPESINASNLPQILNADGSCKWKYIVEGANLFCTQPARLELEKLGVILIKDATANKGGVTSSSKEVTAALALSDEEFKEHMVERKDGSLPDFYQAYVKDIIGIVEKNARDEFDCLWKAHAETNLPFCELTDKVSLKINSIADGIGASNLWDNKQLRDKVFKESLPSALLEKIGLDKFYERVPLNYQQAMFSCYLACQFVYKKGYTATEFALFDFLAEYQK